MISLVTTGGGEKVIYKTFEEWMKNEKGIDPTKLDMSAKSWDKYLDEYNLYKEIIELIQESN